MFINSKGSEDRSCLWLNPEINHLRRITMEDNKIKFRTLCAWCNCLISEKEYPKTEKRLALSKNGIIISHDICDKCRRTLENLSDCNKEER
jgi:hypothetical protein